MQKNAPDVPNQTDVLRKGIRHSIYLWELSVVGIK